MCLMFQTMRFEKIVFFQFILSLALKNLQQDSVRVMSTNKYIELCSYLLYYTEDYVDALHCFDWLIDRQHGSPRFCKLLAAHCKKELSDYQGAKKLLTEVRWSNIFLYKWKKN